MSIIIFYNPGIILYGRYMKTILISACLLGDMVRYDGGSKFLGKDIAWRLSRCVHAVKLCPELAGGLPVPRAPAQISGGSGLDVLDGNARVIDENGNDLSDFFIKGAEYALSLAQKTGAVMAVLKDKSPSCGVYRIHDGSFSSAVVPGCGVTAALLKINGIEIFSENDLENILTNKF
jgi:uncharacterized protein YbbK (DUF523 family)